MRIEKYASIIVFFYVLIFSEKLLSQQQSQSSLYFFNQHFFNPAYICVNKGITFVADGRNQWVSFKGAPKTANFSVFGSLGNNLGTGLSVQTDKIGANQTTSFLGNFAYDVFFKKKKNQYKIKILKTQKSSKDLNHLAFGLSFGANYYQTMYSGLKVIDNSEDVYQDHISYSQTTMNVGFGAMFYNSTRFIGVSVPSLIQNKLSATFQAIATEKRHIYAVAGFVKEFDNGLIVRPSTVIKMVSNAPIAYDISLSCLIKERLWIGVLYKNNPAVGFNVLILLPSNIRVGYAYEQQFTSMQRNTSGSHEILLSYQIAKKKKKNGLVNCPKF